MSIEFIQSQIDYYRKHLLSGNAADQSRIRGSLIYYEQEMTKLKREKELIGEPYACRN